MTRSESVKEIGAAIAKAQGEISPAVKDSVNPHLRSKYANLASVWEACRAPLAKYGIAVVQSPAFADGKGGVTTLLIHGPSGEWMENTLMLPLPKQDPQGVGVAVTYARRYSLAAMIGVVADEDDDGEGAKGSKEAAAAVAEQKLAEARAAAEAAKKPDSAKKEGSKDFQMLAAFADLKKQIAEVTETLTGAKKDYAAYYEALEPYKSSKDITDPTEARRIYKAVAAKLKELRQQVEEKGIGDAKE